MLFLFTELTSLWPAQGTASAEVQAVRQAGEGARGATAYLNLETGDCHGDDTSVTALVQSRVRRVVVGLRHPLSHLRGKAVQALRHSGIRVDVAGEGSGSPEMEEAWLECLAVNEVMS
jgi:diaminohydroxyphosphoribosylaminopyrimidine deaminase/5-amino-6-(5-phosphoribosylamino)uracil reductase